MRTSDECANSDRSVESAEDYCAVGMDKWLNFQADAMQHIDAAIRVNANHSLPRVIKSWMLHGSRDARYLGTVNDLLAPINDNLTQLSDRERTLVEALNLSRTGLGIESATILADYLRGTPGDLLVHYVVQEEIFWLGRPEWMRAITEDAAAAWQETSEGYGSFLSLRAFAAEEAGYLGDAERYGRAAIEINPADIWGAHAVAHVLLMKGETRKGIEWIEHLSPHWRFANQMKHHLWWHQCLFLFELADYDRIFSLLQTEIRNPDSTLVQASPAAPIDIQNYASLLLRLEMHGVDAGGHWEVLASICADRVNNHGNAFGNIHDMMVLAATGQQCKAMELIHSMRDCYRSQSGSVAQGYVAVGIPVCEAIQAYFSRDYEGVLNLLGGVRHNLSMIGASHAQRDVFYQMLVYASDQTGRDDLRKVFLADIERIGFSDVPDRAVYKGVVKA